MPKYKITFEVDPKAPPVAEFETDIEPPRAGDFINVRDLPKSQVTAMHQVTHVFWIARSSERVDVVIRMTPHLIGIE